MWGGDHVTGTPPLLPWTHSTWEPRTASTGESKFIILIRCLRGGSVSFNLLQSAGFLAVLWTHGSAFIWLSWSGSGSVLGVRIRPREHGNLPKFSNKPVFLHFKKAFVPSQVRFLIHCHFNYIFHVKVQIFVTLKFDQDPDPHESALDWLPGSGSAWK